MVWAYMGLSVKLENQKSIDTYGTEMNIILNSYCNLKCNYCFADEYMEETVRTPGKSMDFDYFINDLLPKIKNTPVINFMGGEPTLHPQFNDIFTQTLDAMPSYTSLGLFTNGLMGDKVLDTLVNVIGRDGALKRKITFSVLLNWQTLDNISKKKSCAVSRNCRNIDA